MAGVNWTLPSHQRVLKIPVHRRLKQKKLEFNKKVCENKIFCNIIMPSEDTKILELNQCQKSGKVPFIIYADLECIMEKID